MGLVRPDQAMLHLLTLLLLALAPATLADCDGTVEIESSDVDHWQAKLILVSDTAIEAWVVKIIFDMEVDFIESAMAEVTGSGKMWTLRNKEWDGGLDAGDELSLKVTWDCSDAFTVEDEASGSWNGLVSIPGPLNGWTLALGFSSSVDFLESSAATATGSGVSWELANKDWDAEIPDGQSLSLRFIVDYSGERPGVTKL